MSVIRSHFYRQVLFVSLLVMATLILSCNSDPTSSSPQIENSAYSLSLRGSVTRDFENLTVTEAAYKASILESTDIKTLILEFKVEKSYRNQDIRNRLLLWLPLNTTEFDLQPGNYQLEPTPGILNTLNGNVSYVQEEDPLNREAYHFLAESANLAIDSADESHIKGRMVIQLQQKQGIRITNGISEEINLAFGGRLQTEVEFDLVITKR